MQYEKSNKRRPQKVAILAEEKGIIKPKSIIIPKNLKYDRITITKQRTWERLGIWLD